MPEGMAVAVESEFAHAVNDIFILHRPLRIVETGTYMGKGTSRIICEAVRRNLLDAEFISIEVNPEHHRQATANLAAAGFTPTLLCGLSIPRSLVPSLEQIRCEFVENPPQGVYVDHSPETRAKLYHDETNFDGPDNLLAQVLAKWDYRPDLILLDSGGHVGHIEFLYTLSLVKGPCVFILDDVAHCKHAASLRIIKADPRFSLLVESSEKFGFAVAKFTPEVTR